MRCSYKIIHPFLLHSLLTNSASQLVVRPPVHDHLLLCCRSPCCRCCPRRCSDDCCASPVVQSHWKQRPHLFPKELFAKFSEKRAQLSCLACLSHTCILLRLELVSTPFEKYVWTRFCAFSLQPSIRQQCWAQAAVVLVRQHGASTWRSSVVGLGTDRSNHQSGRAG